MIFAKVFCMALLLGFSSCGGGDYAKDNTPTLPPVPANPEAWNKIFPTVKAECVRCHNGIKQKPDFQIEDNFRLSRAEIRIKNNTMPPDRRLSDASKNILLSYFSGTVQ